MKFLEKLDSFLHTLDGIESSVFVQWVIERAHLGCSVDTVITITEQADDVLFDVEALSINDLKNLRLFFRLPENTPLIHNKLSVTTSFLCDIIFPLFASYANHLAVGLAQNEPNEPDEDGFDIVDSDDYNDDNHHAHFNDFPWLNPSHPLCFSSTQSPLARWEDVNKFSVEKWYPHLRKYTFKSSFLTLNRDDIQFLMGHAAAEYDSTQLERVLDHMISQFNTHKVFMRLSTRSPKDSKHLFDKAATIMSQDAIYWNETENKHQQLVSFVASMTKAMQVTTGKEIIEAITGSPRVYNDFLSLVNLPDPLHCATKVILREWYTIRPDHEFRVFVSRRCRKESIVTAISQYFHFLYFDKTPVDCFNAMDEENKHNLIVAFQHYVLKLIDPAVSNFLNFSSEHNEDNSRECIREYVVDLALIPINQYRGDQLEENVIHIGGCSYVIMMIELNPFSPSVTGSFLFDWKTDLNLLWGKESCAYPVLRTRTTPRDNFQSVTLLPQGYEQVIQNALSKRLIHSTPPVDSKPIHQLEAQPGSTDQGIRFFSSSQSLEEAQMGKAPSSVRKSPNS